MRVRPAEYGARGVLGLGVPQANPTVEPELQLLRPAGVSLLTARLLSPAADPRQRLLDYLDGLADTLAQFDTLALDAFGFACTGSTYLHGHAAERARVASLEEGCGYPVITAAAAIETALRHLGAERLLLVAPYPGWLGERAVAYWQGRGFAIRAAELAALPSADTRNIYGLDHRPALDLLRAMDRREADAVLFSGTGMPSLRAVLAAREELGLAALSSNLALGWALARQLGCVAAGAGPEVLLPAAAAGVAGL